MGTALEAAGKDGSRSFDDLGKSAESSSDKMNRLENEATAIGAVMGVVAAGVMQAGAAYRDQERQLDALNRLYGEGADELIDYTETMQDLGIASNDTARQVAISFNTLNENYAISGDQIEELMMRTVDLAELTGRSMEDVSERVQAAIRGEAESIEALGVTLNDTFVASEYAARGLGNWNKVTDEAAKAQFRYQLLLEQTADAQGYAAERAEGAVGAYREFIWTIQDGVQAVGGFLGPLGQIAAEMAPLAMAAPVVAAGIGRMTVAMRGSAVAAAALRVGMTGLSVALSPIGLALGAIVAIGGSVVDAYLDQKNAAEDYNASLLTLDDTLEMIRRRGDEQLAAMGEDIRGTINDIREDLSNFGEDTEPLRLDFESDTEWRLAVVEHMNAIEDTREAADLATPAINAFNDAMSSSDVDVDAYAAWALQLLETSASTETLTDDIDALNQIIATQNEMPTEFLTAYAEGIEGVIAGSELLAGVFAATSEEAVSASDQIKAAIESEQQAQEDAAAAAKERIEELAQAQSDYNQSVMEWLANGDNILGFLDDFSVKAREGTQWFQEFSREFNAGFNMDAANQSFDQVLRTFDQIDQIASRPARATSIAEALIGPPGEWAAIDDLLTHGRISLDEYNAAVEAGYGIQGAQVEVLESLNVIRANQIPLLAEEHAAYQDNIRAIAELNPMEQRRALMLQDTAVQAQIASQYSTAYAASVGEIPESVATEMILNAAGADAGLKDLLTQFGLIEEMPDGELRVNFPDADKTIDAIDRMTIGFLHLATVGSEIKPFELAVSLYGEEEANELFGLVEEADGKQAEMSVGAVTEGIEEALDGIRQVELADGTVVTVKTEVDTSDWDQLTAAELATRFDNDPVQLPVEAVVQPMDNVSADEWNAMIGPFPEIEVPVSVKAATAASGDGTGGAQDWKAMLDIPDQIATIITAEVSGGEDVNTLATDMESLPDTTTASVTASVTGTEDVTSASEAVTSLDGASAEATVSVVTVNAEAIGDVMEMIRTINESGAATVTVNIEADTSGLAGLGNLGIYTGGNESGGAAAIESPTVTVMFEADTSDVDSWTPPTFDPISIAVSTPGAIESIGYLNGVQVAAGAVPEAETVSVSTPGAIDSIGNLNGVQSAAEAIPENETVGVSVAGWVSAVSALNSVANAANNIPGSVSTTIYTDRVTRYSSVGDPRSAFALGGTIWDEMEPPSRWGVVPTAANGRNVWVGEAGPELVTLPHGAQVTPHVASLSRAEGSGGDINVYVTVQGSVTSEDDLAITLTQKIGPAIAQAVRRQERGLGVTS